ncbi:MAG: sulfatase [Pseudomonadota bacterium]
MRLLIVSLASALISCAPVHSQDKPNIVVFIADDLGWEDIGPYGHETVQTPNLDRLAAEGMLFENAMLTSPQCSPSRISLLTGLYPHQTGTEDLHSPLSPEFQTVATHLNQAGYFTGLLEKDHLGPTAIEEFDFFDPLLNGLTSFLDQAGDQPFFLWAASIDPHRPYGGEPGPSGTHGAADRVHNADTIPVRAHLIDDAATRGDLALYLDEIHRFDLFIGDVTDELETRGLAENTLVLFLADNGAPFPREKGSLYDAGIKSPLIAHMPSEIPAGAVHSSQVSLINLAPTLLDYAGIDAPAYMEGRSLRPALQGETTEGDAYTFAARDWHNIHEHQRMVRTDQFKLIWVGAHTAEPIGVASDLGNSPSWYSLQAAELAGTLTAAQSRLFEAPRASIEFYDLLADPGEYVNQAANPEFAAQVSALSAELRAWRVRTNDHEPTERRRGNNVDRITGIKFQPETPPLYDLTTPPPTLPE